MTEEIAEYLGRKSAKERKMATFRCGNEERENRYWMEGEERENKSRNGCSEMRQREEKERGEIQNEDGREIRWIKEI
jgi:hypothetical protein